MPSPTSTERGGMFCILKLISVCRYTLHVQTTLGYKFCILAVPVLFFAAGNVTSLPGSGWYSKLKCANAVVCEICKIELPISFS